MPQIALSLRRSRVPPLAVAHNQRVKIRGVDLSNANLAQTDAMVVPQEGD
jgi:hypothetical protein